MISRAELAEKEQGLLAFLREYAAIRRKRKTGYGQDDVVIWFHELPHDDPDCRSLLASDGPVELDGRWVQVRKRNMPLRPTLPKDLGPWIPQSDLDHFDTEPELTDEITVLKRNIVEDEHGQLISELVSETCPLDDHPEIEDLWLQYLVDHWEPWAEDARQWRRVQEVYEQLDLVRRRLEESEERYEFRLAVGFLQWLDPKGTRIERHVLTAPIEITLEAARGNIRVDSDTSVPGFRVELDMMDLADQPKLDEGTITARLQEFDTQMWDTTLLGPVLNEIASRFNAMAQVHEAQERPGSRVDEVPRFSYAPALVLRSRRPIAYDDLVRAFSEAVAELPVEGTHPWTRFLAEGEELECDDTFSPDNTAAAPHAPVTEHLLFPLATNEQQRRIVDRLNNDGCVVVTGPPGTGKSHTIANLTSHLLARGERVLVTAQAPKALTVLRDLLPKQLRDLNVTSLGSSFEDQKLLEQSVGRILSKYNEWQARTADYHQAGITRAEEALVHWQKELAKTEREVRELREAETRHHTHLHQPYQGTLVQIALEVEGARERFEWLPESSPTETAFPLRPEEVGVLVELHRTLTQDLLDELLYDLGDKDLPEPQRFRQLLGEWANAVELADTAAASAPTEAITMFQPYPQTTLTAIHQTLCVLDELTVPLEYHFGPIAERILSDCVIASTSQWADLVNEFRSLSDQAAGHAEQLGRTEIHIPTHMDHDRLLVDADRRLSHFRDGGKRGFGPFAPRIVKETAYVADCAVDFQNADTPDRLVLLSAHLNLERIERDLRGMWEVYRHKTRYPSGTELDIVSLANSLGAVLSFFESESSQILRYMQHTAGLIASAVSRAELIAGAHAQLAAMNVREVTLELEKILERVRVNGASLSKPHPCLSELGEAVQERDWTSYEYQWNYRERLRTHKRDYDTYLSLINRLGGSWPDLEHRLHGYLGNPEQSTKLAMLLPAWRWATARKWLRRSTKPEAYERANRLTHGLQARVAKATGELAALLAWRAFFNRLDNRTIGHLQAWTMAIKKIGKGTGKFAYHWKREAQKHLMGVIPTIPAWVMPLHRVWDTVSPEPGLFDTVIIDEASQAGQESLLLLLLAKRVIVVGDDKQNSPEGIGVKHNETTALISQHLSGFEFGSLFAPTTSFFDHAQRAFGSSSVTLLEHFRCVPEIIRFSNDRFYTASRLIPLRQPPPRRLSPLIHRFVPEGHCDGKGARLHNQAEATAMVETVVSVVKDSSYKDKTIGVIALQGHLQPDLIANGLAKALSPSEIERHRLRCGIPATFQGDERDVMFLSMVHAPNHRTAALTTLSHQRRYNVAMSRARDQVWLFHSVEPRDLSPMDLRYELLSYFLNPDGSTLEGVSEDLDHLAHDCSAPHDHNVRPAPYDSWFEIHVAQELLRRKYTIEPQVEVAGRRIDLVVEGLERRLPIECDGDAWHGPDRFDADMDRQRQLERCGWTFVRVRESDFIIDREGALRPVIQACDRLGIRPVGFPPATAMPSPMPSEVPVQLDHTSEKIIPVDRPQPSRRPTRPSPEPLSVVDSGDHDGDLETDSEESFYREAQLAAETEPTHARVQDRPQCGPDRGGAPVVAASGTAAAAQGTITLSDRQPFTGYSNLNFPDPRISPLTLVDMAILKILELDGPLPRQSLYRLYVRGCRDLQRVGKVVKKGINAGISRLLSAGKVDQSRELCSRGILICTVLREADTDPVRLRSKGGRDLLDIPPSELRVVSQQYEHQDYESLFRTILDYYGYARLTKKRRGYLARIFHELV